MNKTELIAAAAEKGRSVSKKEAEAVVTAAFTRRIPSRREKVQPVGFGFEVKTPR